MINLFNIPEYRIDTSQFSNLLHDKIVRKFEEKFAQYVGAKYAVSFNSATSAIFLLFLLRDKYSKTVTIPSLIPPVVPNAIINAGGKVVFNDNVDWIGGSYYMGVLGNYHIIDSAQKVEKNQFHNYRDNDVAIFSFYPTKPVGSCDGGMIVSNDEGIIEELRTMSFNGMSQEANNWDRQIRCLGHKMYMNSIQAYIANKNLDALEGKKVCLSYLRKRYNTEFGLHNNSDHLYRMDVSDQSAFIEKARTQGIVCGIHYKPCHTNPLYKDTGNHLHKSIAQAKSTVSIPFHEAMSIYDIQKVIDFVHENR